MMWEYHDVDFSPAVWEVFLLFSSSLLLTDVNKPTLTVHWLRLVMLCRNCLSGFSLSECVRAWHVCVLRVCVCFAPGLCSSCTCVKGMSPMIQLCERAPVVVFCELCCRGFLKGRTSNLTEVGGFFPLQEPSSCLPGYVALHAQFHCQQTWNKEGKFSMCRIVFYSHLKYTHAEFCVYYSRDIQFDYCLF